MTLEKIRSDNLLICSLKFIKSRVFSWYFVGMWRDRAIISDVATHTCRTSFHCHSSEICKRNEKSTVEINYFAYLWNPNSNDISPKLFFSAAVATSQLELLALNVFGGYSVILSTIYPEFLCKPCSLFVSCIHITALDWTSCSKQRRNRT